MVGNRSGLSENVGVSIMPGLARFAMFRSRLELYSQFYYEG